MNLPDVIVIFLRALFAKYEFIYEDSDETQRHNIYYDQTKLEIIMRGLHGSVDNCLQELVMTLWGIEVRDVIGLDQRKLIRPLTLQHDVLDLFFQEEVLKPHISLVFGKKSCVHRERVFGLLASTMVSEAVYDV